MKILISTLLLFWSIVAKAQQCAGYYYLAENAKIVMTNYDRKDKISSTVTYNISDVAKDGAVLTASFSSEVVDDKGKTMGGGAGKFKCSGDKIYVDASVAMPSGQMEAYKNMEIKADEVFIEYPSAMSVGQDLPDADFKMVVSNKGAVFSTITFKQVNRKVAGKEKIATPAGEWECWKLTSESQFKASVGNSGFGIPIKMQITEWFAPGFGIVKSETANKNGKLMGYSVISAVGK